MRKKKGAVIDQIAGKAPQWQQVGWLRKGKKFSYFRRNRLRHPEKYSGSMDPNHASSTNEYSFESLDFTQRGNETDGGSLLKIGPKGGSPCT